MNDVVLTGLRGMQTGMEQAARDSQRVVRSFLPDATEDPIAPLIDLKVDQFHYSASAKVVEIGAKMWKTTLDILA